MSTEQELLEELKAPTQEEPELDMENQTEEDLPKSDEKDVTRSRKDRPTGSTHFGDTDFTLEEIEELGDATWGEVCRYCCVHSAEEWVYIALGVFVVCFFLYFFLLGLELLGTSAKIIGGCTAGKLFGDDTNPIAGLMVGILSTVLLQSSSTTTSIVVSLVDEEEGIISVAQGIYMIMGANIGTSVTNTIVALGQMGDGDQLERAFAGATVHDCFNFLSVCILLPVEVITGYLDRLTGRMVAGASPEKGEKWEGPLKKMVSPLGDKIIKANKDVIKAVANGESCSIFYPVQCDDGIVSDETCTKGLIDCDGDTNECPAFFQDGATRKDDEVSGGVMFFISLCILFFCLIGLVMTLQKMLLGASTRIIYKATNINGYLGIILGTGITIVVQSSSITTSALTPLVGMGVLRLEQMLPLTLGANIGTTLTAIMAALVSSGTDSLQVALAHLLFNLTGIAIWYPIPFMRQVPLNMARRLGRTTRIWRGFPVVYIIVMFFIIPLILLGISSLFEQDSKGFTTLGSFISAILGILIIYTVYKCKYKGGKEQCIEFMKERQFRRQTMQDLPEDMKYLKAKVDALVEHTGLPEEDDEGEEGEKKGSSDVETEDGEITEKAGGDEAVSA